MLHAVYHHRDDDARRIHDAMPVASESHARRCTKRYAHTNERENERIYRGVGGSPLRAIIRSITRTDHARRTASTVPTFVPTLCLTW